VQQESLVLLLVSEVVAQLPELEWEQAFQLLLVGKELLLPHY
tara:strand:- start:171 stop:296 length:126 start_codon:yes stop_codon:yes gene_type:complete